MNKCHKEISKTVHDFDLNEPIYTIKEISDITGFSRQSFERWHSSGVFLSNIYVYNNRNYRYYTDEQLKWFYSSDLYLNSNMVKNKDIIGRRFGKLVVLSYSESAKSKGYYGSYNCICDCGETIVVSRVDLLRGKMKSCGCRYIDISGETFGKWSVLKLSDVRKTSNGNSVYYYTCECECGEVRDVTRRSLISGRSYSCGCFKDESSMSKSEFQVMNYLDKKGFYKSKSSNRYYCMYKSFNDLKGVNGGRLSYDFYVNYSGVEYLIECQGGQHYRPIDLWGGEKAFNLQIEHDRLKSKYAVDNGYKLLIIGESLINYDDIEKFLDEYLVQTQ